MRATFFFIGRFTLNQNPKKIFHGLGKFTKSSYNKSGRVDPQYIDKTNFYVSFVTVYPFNHFETIRYQKPFIKNKRKPFKSYRMNKILNKFWIFSNYS